ncbi:MAG: hypothetical protein IOC82_13530 [Aestuariivirga sp.]|uniref:hypothetical protein n=1 Tax=Aestuariivirga sp. TaxID=2650926 RepID=UPI0025BD9FD9|nr:hypothetical protein [Aestuariivirga sp.]MCA3562040.1 hypothetical protein [Aestuariivirga sp.]
MSVTYRIPTLADAESIARLHVACWREAYAGIVPIAILEQVDMAGRIARWAAHLQDATAQAYLAEVPGEAAGFIHRGLL